MQDLEIKGTGNSRFLKSSVPATTTWEDFLTMLRAGNLPIDLTGLNSAGIITQNPSAYNKANVLPDDVCTALGIPNTSEPKDAFLAAVPQVGDILTTTRTDLGDNWLLCNGDSVNSTDYPALSTILVPNVITDMTPLPEMLRTDGTPITSASDVRIINGNYVCDKFYSTTLDGPWTTARSSSSGGSVVPKLYANNNYIVIRNESVGYGFVMYAATIDPITNGTNWATALRVDAGEQSSGYRVILTDVVNGGGYFLVVGEKQTGPYAHRMFYAYSTKLSEAWEQVESVVGYHYSGQYYGAKYLDGKFVLWGQFMPKNGNAQNILTILYPSDMSSESKILIYEDSSHTGRIRDVVYENGYWVVLYETYASSKHSINIAYNTSLASEGWTHQTILISTNEQTRGLALEYTNGNYIIGGQKSDDDVNVNGMFIYFSSLDGPYNFMYYSDIMGFNSFCLDGDIKLVACKSNNSGLAFLDESKITLPEISLSDKTYTYIKAE